MKLLIPLCLAVTVAAQPQPGDVFREYAWSKPDGDAGGSLRVGGRLDYGGGPISLPHAVDLAEAVRAEVVIEKLLCHDGTRGLAIAFNGHEPIVFPEADGIPAPPWDYQYFTCPLAAVPLEHLVEGTSNSFRLTVSGEHSWNWPQNLIYGLQLRIYYDAVKKGHRGGRLASPKDGQEIGRTLELRAEAPEAKRVEFVGQYRGVNWEGDGQYWQWHYTYFKGTLTNHLATVKEAPWQATWDAEWIPDQQNPMKIAARITDGAGLIYMTEAAGGLQLKRQGLSVELCEPYDVPKKWVTRAGEKSQKFRIEGDLQKATAARLVFSSWSPGYMNGLFINGKKVFEKEGPLYACYWHRIPLEDLSVLREGENVLTTGMTPRHDGEMVHGMEVNWPGVMVLIQYRTAP